MSDDPNDQLLLHIRGAVAEYERTLISDRMRRGQLARDRAGQLLAWTRPPYGYRTHPDRPRDPDGVQIEASEAAVVREMYAWFSQEGHSIGSLAERLTGMGVPTPTGRARWVTCSVRLLLTNPVYKGEVYVFCQHVVAGQLRGRANPLKPAVAICPLPNGPARTLAAGGDHPTRG